MILRPPGDDAYNQGYNAQNDSYYIFDHFIPFLSYTFTHANKSVKMHRYVPYVVLER